MRASHTTRLLSDVRVKIKVFNGLCYRISNINEKRLENGAYELRVKIRNSIINNVKYVGMENAQKETMTHNIQWQWGRPLAGVLSAVDAVRIVVVLFFYFAAALTHSRCVFLMNHNNIVGIQYEFTQRIHMEYIIRLYI